MNKIFQKIKDFYTNNPDFWNEKEIEDDDVDYNDEVQEQPSRTAGSSRRNGYRKAEPAEAPEQNYNYGYYNTDSYSSSDDGEYLHIKPGASEGRYGRKPAKKTVGNVFDSNGAVSDFDDEQATQSIRRHMNSGSQSGFENSVYSGNRGYSGPSISVVDPVSFKDDIEKLMKEIRSDKIVLFCLDKCTEDFEKEKIRLFTAGVVFDRSGQFAEIRKDYYIVIPANATINEDLTNYIRNSGLVSARR